MKLIGPSILSTLMVACVPSGEFVDFKDDNTSSFADLQTRLEALESKNTELESSLATTNTNLESTQESLNAAAASLEAAETEIEELKTENSQLQNDLSIANDNINDLQTTVSTIIGGTSITEQVVENAASIALILSDQQEAQMQITALETAGTAAATEMTTLSASVATNTSDIATHSATLSTNSSNISSNSSSISTLNTNVATNTAAIATFTSEIAGYASTIATNTATTTSNATNIASNTASITANASDISSVQTDVSDAQTDISSMQSDLDSAEVSIATLQGDYTDLSANVLTLIDTDTTWSIDASGGGDYDNLEDAMVAARSVSIHPDATLTMQLENGTYAHTQAINLFHPQGENIEILGDPFDSSAVTLSFTGSSGLRLYNKGAAIGMISSLTLQGDLSTDGRGIHIDHSYAAVRDVVIDNFESECILVANRSKMVFLDDNILSNCDVGLRLTQKSDVLQASGTIEISASAHNGVIAEHLSYLSLIEATVSGSTGNGIAVWKNSFAELSNITSSSNGHSGLWLWGAVGHVSSSTFSNNNYDGVTGSRHSTLGLYSVTLTGNTRYGVNNASGSFNEKDSGTSSSSNTGGSYYSASDSVTRGW